MRYVDQFSDPAFGVFVKQAAVRPAFAALVGDVDINPGDGQQLPADAFAWPDERMFPVHTDKHAALSYVYAESCAAPKSVRETIKQALEAYGIDEATLAVQEVKQAADTDDDFILPDLKLFRVKSAEEFRTSEAAFLTNFNKLDVEHRALGAARLREKAAEFDCALSMRAQQYSGQVLVNTKTAREWITARTMAAPAHAAQYLKLAAALPKAPYLQPGQGVVDFVTALHEVDKVAGVEKHYDRKLPDPMATVYNTEKVAADTMMVNGKALSLQKLAGLPASFWADLGGQELADEIAPGGRVDAQKMATVIDTLPLDLKVVLASQVA